MLGSAEQRSSKVCDRDVERDRERERGRRAFLTNDFIFSSLAVEVAVEDFVSV